MDAVLHRFGLRDRIEDHFPWQVYRRLQPAEAVLFVGPGNRSEALRPPTCHPPWISRVDYQLVYPVARQVARLPHERAELAAFDVCHLSPAIPLRDHPGA